MNSIFEDLWVRETMVLFRKWRILFMEGARMQSVHEFEGEMWVNGWEWEEEESWIWKSINHESLQEPGHTGFYKPYKEMDFFPRKWRSFKGLRQVTDMTKFLFWNAHSDCRSASLEGGRPVSKHLKWEGTMVRTYPGCFVPQYVHLEFIHLCQNLWDIEIYLPAHWLHGSPQ